MKKHNLLLIIPFAILACNKSNPKPAENLLIGSDEKIEKNNPETHSTSVYLDMNGDGTNDFRILKDAFSNGGTSSSSFIINPLHDNALVLYTAYSDSIFTEIDTQYVDGSPTQMNIISTNNCNGNGTFKEMRDSKFARFLNEGDELFSEDNWSSSFCRIQDVVSTSLCGLDQSNPDTSIYNACNTSYTCHDAPILTESYIGVKIIKRNKEKLGWIRLNLFQSLGTHDFNDFVVETAIQK